jgi:transposase-like protein
MFQNLKSAGTALLAQPADRGASTRLTSRSRVAGPISTALSKAGKTVDFLLRAKRDVAAAKVFFRRAFASRGRLPDKITLDGYQASHRAAREVLAQRRGGGQTKIRSSKYLNNLIEQDHRPIKLRLGPMLGLKRFRNASIAIAGVELMHRIRKGQFKLATLRIKEGRAPEIWNAGLAA